MPLTASAQYLGAHHAQAPIFFLLHLVRRRGRCEAWPAAAGVKLFIGAEELGAAPGTTIHAGLMVVPVLAGERPFRPFFAQHLVSLRCELPAPLLFGFPDLIRHHCSSRY